MRSTPDPAGAARRGAARIALAALSVCLLAACGSAARAPRAELLLDERTEAAVTAAIAAALNGDAAADSLFAPDATVVADGTERLTWPRIAGVEGDGPVAITRSRIEVRSGLAWTDLDYRWLSTSDNLVREGRATLILTPRRDGEGWWVVHAHSSVGRGAD